MNIGRIVKVAVAGGIVYNILDFVALNYILKGAMEGMAPIMNPEPVMAYNILNNFIAALVVGVVWDRVRGSFGTGVGSGLQFGAYAGLLVNMPMWLALRVFIKDISYGNAWIFTIYGLVAYSLMGATAALVEGMGEGKAAA